MNREEIYTKRIGKDSAEQKQLPHADSLKTSKIALFFCISDAQGLSEALAIRKKVNTDYPQAETIFFLPSVKNITATFPDEVIILQKKDFNLLGKIKRKTVTKLRHAPYDLLITFTVSVDNYCGEIITAIKASVKAGIASKQSEQFFDISIGSNENFLQYETFYHQLLFYLRQMHINFSNNKNGIK